MIVYEVSYLERFRMDPCVKISVTLCKDFMWVTFIIGCCWLRYKEVLLVAFWPRMAAYGCTQMHTDAYGICYDSHRFKEDPRASRALEFGAAGGAAIGGVLGVASAIHVLVTGRPMGDESSKASSYNPSSVAKASPASGDGQPSDQEEPQELCDVFKPAKGHQSTNWASGIPGRYNVDTKFQGVHAAGKAHFKVKRGGAIGGQLGHSQSGNRIIDCSTADSGVLSCTVVGKDYRNLKQLNLPLDPQTILLFYGGNLTAARSLFEDYPINTDNRPVIEYQAPRTYRRKMRAESPWFVGPPFADFVAKVQALCPPDRDPLLTRRSVANRRLPLAGHAFHRARIAELKGDANATRQAWEAFLKEWTDQ